jgi:hypothetical protein
LLAAEINPNSRVKFRTSLALRQQIAVAPRLSSENCIYLGRVRGAIFKAAAAAGLVVLLVLLGPQLPSSHAGDSVHAISKASVAENGASTLELHDSPPLSVSPAPPVAISRCAWVARPQRLRLRTLYSSHPLSVRPPPEA